MTLWTCAACGEPQVSWAPLPVDHLCHPCRDTARARAEAETTAGIPARYRNLTRDTWVRHFHRRWPAEVTHWTGHPHWLAIWGPTGTGKTGLATVLLSEHLRTQQEPFSPLPAGGWEGDGRGARGEGAFPPAESSRATRSFPTARWISALALAERLRREIGTDGDILAPLLVTGLLLIDEPLAVDATPWFFDRLGLLCRARDEAGLPTIVTLQQDPEELLADRPPAPPALISRWLSGLRLYFGGEDVRLRETA